jgi:hypothetical protein
MPARSAKVAKVCAEDRRSCAEARSRRRVVPASTRGCGSCAGRGSRPARLGRPTGCADSTTGARSRPMRSPAAAPPADSPLFSALQPTLRERTADVNDLRLRIDVAPLEREPFGWSKSGRCREDHHRPVAGREICGDRVELGQGLERALLPAPDCGDVPRCPAGRRTCLRPGEIRRTFARRLSGAARRLASPDIPCLAIDTTRGV